MAKFYPEISQILEGRVKPESGEIHLLNFLEHLDDSFEIFFNPLMNGDRPDIVILREFQGVLIIEVKDYNLAKYKLDSRRNWKLKSNNVTIKSPISQVLKYKDNLFELHIDNLLELKIRDIRNFNTVSSAVYFHNANSFQIEELLVNPFQEDKGYLKFLKYNIDLIGRDTLNELDFKRLLEKRYMISRYPSSLFTKELHKSIRRFLKPPLHLLEHGKDIPYTKKQLEIIHSTTAQQRIKGVVGSGKTTVMAARAVQSLKRQGGKVLILCYNITLKNFIHDKVSDVRESFSWGDFTITNYHEFINSELNNLEIPIEIPKDFNVWTEKARSEFFEKKYYSNKILFRERINDIQQYEGIFIDEIQDYKRPWMEILKECFLKNGGTYVLFGDVKQNIYANELDQKDVKTNVYGFTTLERCFRSQFKIKDLAVKFQSEFFTDKYDVDDFNQSTSSPEFAFEKAGLGQLTYIYLSETNTVKSLYTVIQQNAINKDVHPNDIAVLGHSIRLMKEFDAYYRYKSKAKTNTMFETREMVYRMGFNFLGKAKPDWLTNGLRLIKRHNDSNPAKGLNQLSVLFTLTDLNAKYEDEFTNRLSQTCILYKTTLMAYLEYVETNKEAIESFRRDFGATRQSSSINMIRKNKKIHFRMNSGSIKISTVHSFKGWESEMLFLVVEQSFDELDSKFNELLYTGLTRSKSNLVIINFGNEAYHSGLKRLVDEINESRKMTSPLP
jgi:hypothetical protein